MPLARVRDSDGVGGFLSPPNRGGWRRYFSDTAPSARGEAVRSGKATKERFSTCSPSAASPPAKNLIKRAPEALPHAHVTLEDGADLAASHIVEGSPLVTASGATTTVSLQFKLTRLHAAMLALEYELPPVVICTKTSARIRHGQFLEDTRINTVVLVVVEAKDEPTAVERLGRSPKHLIVRLPRTDCGIAFARQCAKLVVEALHAARHAAFASGRYFMMDDDIHGFKLFNSVDRKWSDVPHVTALRYLAWIMSDADLSALSASAERLARYSASHEARASRGEFTFSARMEQLVLLDVALTKGASYLDPSLFTRDAIAFANAKASVSHHSDKIKRTRKGADKQLATYQRLFIGEDWRLNEQLVFKYKHTDPSKLPAQAAGLLIVGKHMPSVVGTS